METYHLVISLTGYYLIKGIFISVLVIIFSSKVFKKSINTQNATGIIRWVLLVYAILFLVYLSLILLKAGSNNYAQYFWERASGKYGVIFWCMNLSQLLPLLLFFKTFGKHIYFILALAVLMNFGWLMESFVIHVTAIHRDYLTASSIPFLPTDNELIIGLKGFVLGALAMLIGNSALFNKKLADNSQEGK